MNIDKNGNKKSMNVLKYWIFHSDFFSELLRMLKATFHYIPLINFIFYSFVYRIFASHEPTFLCESARF